MRKYVISIMLIILVLLFTGCPDKKDTTKDDNKINVMRVDIKASKVFIENYLRFLMKKDNSAMASFYGKKIKARLRNTPITNEPHPVGYKINDGETKDEKVEFKVDIYNESSNSPYFSDDEFTYVIALEHGKSVIDNIIKGTTVDVYEKTNTLYKREGDKLKGEELIALKDLPDYVVPKESSLIEQKFKLPKKAFGPCAISPDKKNLVITSYDKNSFIGILEESESEETFKADGNQSAAGGDNSGGNNGSASGSAGGQSGGQQKNTKLKTVDVYFLTKIKNISFSPNGEMFIVENTPKNGNSQLLVYNTKTVEIIALKMNKLFKKDRFSFSRAYFPTDSEIIFRLNSIKNATREEKQFTGDWKLNLKSGKVKQIQ